MRLPAFLATALALAASVRVAGRVCRSRGGESGQNTGARAPRMRGARPAAASARPTGRHWRGAAATWPRRTLGRRHPSRAERPAWTACTQGGSPPGGQATPPPRVCRFPRSVQFHARTLPLSPSPPPHLTGHDHRRRRRTTAATPLPGHVPPRPPDPGPAPGPPRHRAPPPAGGCRRWEGQAPVGAAGAARARAYSGRARLRGRLPGRPRGCRLCGGRGRGDGGLGGGRAGRAPR